MTSRMAGLGVALAVSAVTLAACGPTDTAAGEATPKPTTTTAKTPQEILTSSVPDEKTGAFAVSIKDSGTNVTGVSDPAGKTLQYVAKFRNEAPAFTMTMSLLGAGGTSYAKISFSPSNLTGLPRLPKKWMVIDPAKLKDKEGLLPEDGVDPDPGYVHEVFENAAGVKRTSAGHYAGTVDLSKTNVGDIVDDDQLKALGTKASAVPFTAAVDGKGRMTELVVKIPAAGKTAANSYTVTYGSYGSAKSPSAPAASDQAAATAAVYDLLNS